MKFSNHERQLNALVYGVLNEPYYRKRIEDACNISVAEEVTEHYVAYISQILEEISEVTGNDYTLSHQEIRIRFGNILGNLESKIESEIVDAMKELQIESSKYITIRAKAEQRAANGLVEKAKEILNEVQNETN